MPRRRKHKLTEPRNLQWREMGAIDTTTEAGRHDLWFERIKRAKDLLEIEERKKRYDETVKLINGERCEESPADVYLNEAFSPFADLAHSTIPGVPPVSVEARRMEHERTAKMVSAFADSLTDSGVIPLEAELYDTEWDSICAGIGVFKCPWSAQFKPTTTRPSDSPEFLQPYVEDAMVENSDPSIAKVSEDDNHAVHLQVHAGVPGLEQHIAEHEESLVGTVKELPDIQRVAWWDFVYDPDATRWQDRQWEAELCEELVSVLQDIPGVKNLTVENCGNASLDENDNGFNETTATNAFDFENTKVRVWKIHDRRHDEYVIIPDAEGCKPVLEADWIYPGLDIYNVLVHTGQRIPGQIHGVSLMELARPTLEEMAHLNKRIRRQIDKKAASGPVAARGALTAQDKQQLSNEETMIKEVSASAIGTWKDWDPDGIPQDFLMQMERLEGNLRRILGNDVMMQGGDSPHSQTATEAGLRGQYNENRMTRRKADISDTMSWIVRTWVMLVRAIGGKEIPVRIAGPVGMELAYLSPSEIPDDLAFTLDIESLDQGKKAQELQGKVQWYQAAMGVAAVNPQAYDPIKLTNWLAVEMGIRDPERFQPSMMDPTMAAPAMPGQPGMAGQNMPTPSMPMAQAGNMPEQMPGGVPAGIQGNQNMIPQAAGMQ